MRDPSAQGATDEACSQQLLLSRRQQLLALVAAACIIRSQVARAAEIPSAPAVGVCADCIGEVEGSLNACQLDYSSCVSTSNDDEEHFVPPWQYDNKTDDAVRRLIDVATGAFLPSCSNICRH